MAKPKKYRKKPIIVNAMQWTGNNYEEILVFSKGNCYLEDNGYLYLETPKGDVRVKKDDYIVKKNKDEFYLYKKEIFEQTYEEV